MKKRERKDGRFPLRLEPSLKAKLEKVAAANHESVSQLIRRLLWAEIERHRIWGSLR